MPINNLNRINRKEPTIDEKFLIHHIKPEYDIYQQIYFSAPKNTFEKTLLFEPSFQNISHIKIDENSAFNKFPKIDLNFNFKKIPSSRKQEVLKLTSIQYLNYFQSILLHIGLLLSFLLLNNIFRNPIQNNENFDVIFGVQDLVEGSQPSKKSNQNEQSLATKTAEDLTKLIKNAAPVLKEKSENQNVAKKELLTKDDMVATTNKKLSKQENVKSKHEENKKDHQKILEDEKKQKISLQEYAKRKEEDLRTVDKIKKSGMHNIPPNKKLGMKNKISDIPKNPLEINESSLPNNPLDSKNLATSFGSLDGRGLEFFNSYKLYIRNQLRLNWATFAGTSEDTSNYKAQVSITINSFGYMVGTPKILNTNGNEKFNNDILKCLEDTFPVSKPPPEKIHPPVTFIAIFTSRNVD